MSIENASERQFALTQYGDYLRMCIAHPELTSWPTAQKTYKFGDVRGTWCQNTAEAEKYFWFVGYALHVFDLVLERCPEYDRVITKYLEDHIPTLMELWKQAWRGIHSEALDRLVVDLIGVADNA